MSQDADEVANDDAGYRGITEWTPEATACEDCGRDVNRRWRVSSKLVCVACVPWASERSM